MDTESAPNSHSINLAELSQLHKEVDIAVDIDSGDKKSYDIDSLIFKLGIWSIAILGLIAFALSGYTLGEYKKNMNPKQSVSASSLKPAQTK